jgi:deoxyribodipyrimidine photo-lyase
MKRSIVWFRNDLRLHDNEALVDALAHNDEVIPLFVIDPRLFDGKTSYGLDRTGKYRKRFILESLMDLRNNLRSKGSELYVRVGEPELIIPEIARLTKTSYVYCNRERTRDEVLVQDELEKNLWVIGQEMRYYRGKMLYYTADLPFPVTHCPDTFTLFRKEVEKFVKVREPLPTPVSLPQLSVDIDPGDIPDVDSTGAEVNLEYLRGGETAALRELNYYLWETDHIADYKETRNGLLGRDYSSKFSVHLSKGTLSPKLIYSEIKKYESEVKANKSTYWLVFELLWRDFFRFIGKKHGNKIFCQDGIKGKSEMTLYNNKTLFEKWTSAKTGVPFIDANMRELNATGFMSNRGRQNVASFLVKDMRINWVWGAEYFESLLIDYDPCSNYGNWNYIAGVGTDKREDRYFNIPLQAKKYDPQGNYMRHWLPELKDAPLAFLMNPFSVPKSEYTHDNFYPNPCIEIKNWY